MRKVEGPVLLEFTENDKVLTFFWSCRCIVFHENIRWFPQVKYANSLEQRSTLKKHCILSLNFSEMRSKSRKLLRFKFCRCSRSLTDRLCVTLPVFVYTCCYQELGEISLCSSSLVNRGFNHMLQNNIN